MPSIQDNRARGHFYFDPEDPIYADHFPGRPVVPGSLIIHAFLQAARSADGAVPTGIEQFRFKRFLAPGRYAFEMERRSDGRMACTLLDDGAVVATGVV